jgi:hypothetical protein
MKVTTSVLALLLGAMTSATAMAHHMSPMDPGIGDMMGMHEEAIGDLTTMQSGDMNQVGINTDAAMDPADGAGAPLADEFDIGPGGALDYGAAARQRP